MSSLRSVFQLRKSGVIDFVLHLYHKKACGCVNPPLRSENLLLKAPSLLMQLRKSTVSRGLFFLRPSFESELQYQENHIGQLLCRQPNES